MSDNPYAQLSDDEAAKCRELASLIRRGSATTAVEYGRRLLEVKGFLKHGDFTSFVENECDVEIRVAQNWMNAARWVGKKENGSFLELLPLSLIYELARDDVPPWSEAEIIADVQAGKKVTVAKASERIAQARKDDKEADALADSFLEDLKSDVMTRHQQQRASLRVLKGVVGNLLVQDLRELIELKIATAENGEPSTSEV